MAITYSSPNITIVGGHDNGTATGGTATSLTDSSKAWTVNQWLGEIVYFRSGAGLKQAARILSNTATILTFDVALDVAVAANTTYLILYSLADVKAANDSGGWGQVSQNQDTFTIAQNLVIGDRSSYSGLNTVGKNLTFASIKPGFAILDKGFYIAGLVKDGIGYNGTRLRMPNAPSTAGAGKAYTVTNFSATFDIVAEATAVILFNGSSMFKDYTFYNTHDDTSIRIANVAGNTWQSIDSNYQDLFRFNLQSANTLWRRNKFDFCRSAFDIAAAPEMDGVVINNAFWGMSLTGNNISVPVVGLDIINNRSDLAYVKLWFDTSNSNNSNVKFLDSTYFSRTETHWGSNTTNFMEFSNSFDIKSVDSNENDLSGVGIYLEDVFGTEQVNVDTGANGKPSTIPEVITNRETSTTSIIYNPYLYKRRKYGYKFSQQTRTFSNKIVGEIAQEEDNDLIVASEATALAYNITFNGVNKTISNPDNLPQQNVYDASQAWAATSVNRKYDEPLLDVNTLNSGWTVIYNGEGSIVTTSTSVTVLGGYVEGTSTSGGSNFMYDTTKSLVVDILVGKRIWFPLLEQQRLITSNTATQITVDEDWDINPSTDVYVVMVSIDDLSKIAPSAFLKSGNAYKTDQFKIIIGDGVRYTAVQLDNGGWTHNYDGTAFSDRPLELYDRAIWEMKTNSYTNNFTRLGLPDRLEMLQNPSGIRGSLDWLECSITKEENSGGSFFRAYGTPSITNKIIDCTMNRGGIGGRIGGTNSIYRGISHFDGGTLQQFGAIKEFAELKVLRSSTVYGYNALNSGSITIRDVIGEDLTSAFTISTSFNSSTGKTLTLINVVSENGISADNSVTTSGDGFVDWFWDYKPRALQGTSPLEGVGFYAEDKNGVEYFNDLSDVNGNWQEALLLHTQMTIVATSLTSEEKQPYILKFRKYGLVFKEQSYNPNVSSLPNLFFDDNIFVVASEATAAGYSSKFNINYSTKLITVNNDGNLQELYDYSQYFASQSSNIQSDVPIETNDGLNFILLPFWGIKVVSGKTFTILDGVLLVSQEATIGSVFDIEGVLTIGTSTVLNSTLSGIKIDTPAPATHYDPTNEGGLDIAITGTLNQYGVIETTLPIRNFGNWNMNGSILNIHGIALNAVTVAFVNETSGNVTWEDSRLLTDDVTGQYTWRKAPLLYSGITTQKLSKPWSFSSAAGANINPLVSKYQSGGNISDCTMWSSSTLSSITFRDPISKNDLLLKFLGEIDVAQDGASSNAGNIYVDFTFDPIIRDGSDNSLLNGAIYYLKDSDNGNRTTSHSADKEYSDQTDALGKFTNQFIKERIRYKAYASGAGYPVADIREPFNGWIRGYGFRPFALNSITLNQPYTLDISLSVDVFVSVSEAVAATYSSLFSIDYTTKIISVIGNSDIQQLYDYTQYTSTRLVNVGNKEPLLTSDGINYSLETGWRIELANNSYFIIKKNESLTSPIGTTGKIIKSFGNSTFEMEVDSLLKTLYTPVSDFGIDDTAIIVDGASTNELNPVTFILNGKIDTKATVSIAADGGNSAPAIQITGSPIIQLYGNKLLRIENVERFSGYPLGASSNVFYTVFGGNILLAGTPASADSIGFKLNESRFLFHNNVGVPTVIVDGFDSRGNTSVTDIGISGGNAYDIINSVTGTELSLNGRGVGADYGTQKVSRRIQVQAKDGNLNPITNGGIYIQDYDNGDRPTGYTTSNPTIEDFDGTGITPTNVQLIGVLKDTNTSAGVQASMTYRSKNNDNTDIFDVVVRSYGFKFKVITNVVFRDFTGNSLISTSLENNPYVTLSETNAGLITGVAIDGVLKTITLSEVKTASEIYDHFQWWASQPTNRKYNDALTTSDGSNYNLLSTWKLILDNQVSGGINITGNVELSSIIDLTSHNINGVLTFTTAGTYSITDSTIEEVVNTSGGNVTIQSVNSFFNTLGANITVINTKQFTFTVIGQTGYEWRLYEKDPTTGIIGTVELAGEESATSSTQNYNYNFITNQEVGLQIIKQGYEEFLGYFTLGSSNQNINITISIDDNL